MKPQLARPSKGDPYYNTKDVGGYSPCIKGNPFKRVDGLNVLPNCVGYSTGRFNSIGQYGECKYLGNTNAANFTRLAQRQGLTISPKPTLGGCMVWKGGSTAEGHVAIVEIIKDDNTIVTSESEYYGKPFINYTRVNKDGNWRSGCYWMGESYKFIGCIVNPAIKEDEDMTKAETEKLIRELVPEIIAEMKKETEQKPADDWAREAINMCIARGIMVGYPDGFHPQSDIRREEVAQIVANLTAKE